MMREGARAGASSRHEPVKEDAGVSIVVILNVNKDESIGRSDLSRSLQWLKGANKEFKHFIHGGKQVVQLDWLRSERDSITGELNGKRLVQDEISQGLLALESSWLPERCGGSPVLAIVLMPDFREGDVQTDCGAAALRRVSCGVFVSTALDSLNITYVVLDVREVAALFQLILAHLDQHAVLRHSEALLFANDLLDIRLHQHVLLTSMATKILQDVREKREQAVLLESETLVEQEVGSELVTDEEDLQARAKLLILSFSQLNLSTAGKDVEMTEDTQQSGDDVASHVQVLVPECIE